MAIEYMGSDAYHTDDVDTDAGHSAQFVRDGWWADKLFGGNSPRYYPTGGPFGTGSWAHGRYDSDESRIRIGSAVGPTYLFAAWFKHGSPSLACSAIYLGNDTDIQTQIHFQGDGRVEYNRNTTVLGTSTATISVGVWHHIALKVNLHDSTGTVDIELDGTNILSLTGQDTYAGTAGAEVLWFGLGGDENRSLQWAQPIVWSATGDSPTDLFGMHKIWALRPNGDSATVDWTPQGAGDNYVEVDDVEADDDTTYNSSGTSTDEDRLDCENLPETPDAIYAVQSRVLVKQTDAGNLGLKNGVYAGTTKSVSTERKVGINYEYHTNLFTLNPDDSAAWAEADVNGAQVVYEVG